MSDGDRRAQLRAPLLLKVEYPEYEDYLSDWTANVSARGFFVETDKPFVVGQELATRISFPGMEEPVDIPARVVWWRPQTDEGPSGVGLKISEPKHQRTLIDLAYRALAQADGGPCHVLVVDDDPELLAVYQSAVQRLATEPHSSLQLSLAHNGLEALRVVDLAPPDIVIADLMMPVMDGFELVRRLRANPATAHIPIIAVTAQDWKVVGQEARAAGVDELMQKPFRFGEFLECVALLLTTSRSARRAAAQ